MPQSYKQLVKQSMNCSLDSKQGLLWVQWSVSRGQTWNFAKNRFFSRRFSFFSASTCFVRIGATSTWMEPLEWNRSGPDWHSNNGDQHSWDARRRKEERREYQQLYWNQWGSIRCKHVARWQHLSQIKARLFWLVENVFFPMKTQQAISGTSAATCQLMEPHWNNCWLCSLQSPCLLL